MPVKLFGFTIGSKDIAQVQKPEQSSFTMPNDTLDDGAVTITQNAHFGTYVDLEGSVRNELELITRYREMANHPECDMAINEIINESITHDDDGSVVDIVLDNLKQPETIKKKIIEEFKNVTRMLNFSNMADDLYRRWYIDGRIYFHILVDETKPKEGIQELRYIDPRKIRKVREIKKARDPKTNAEIIQSIAEYYMFNDRGTTTQSYTASVSPGLKIAADSIINCNSGLMDAKNTFVISYLHKAIKPLNQLRMIEDAIVIYRLSRAPERRVFYIDVGNLPKGKAEQYLHDVMVKYRNKIVYDSSTGELRDDRKHMSMLEDFWLPRREGNKGTEITTLPAGQNLGQLEDVQYFQKKLLQSLSVPYSRLEQAQGGGMVGIGRTTEVTRDELRFNKFVNKLRNKFSQIFDNALQIQLVLKGICTKEEWEKFREDIYYDYKKDNNFTELRESDLLQQRVGILNLVEPYVGKYFSQEWVKRNVLKFTDEEIQEMQKQIDAEPPPVDPNAPPQDQMQDKDQQQEESPPVDNTMDRDATETETPELDALVQKFSGNINKK